MSTKEKYSEVIAEALKRFLDEDDWRYSFDEETGIFSFNLSRNEEIKKVEYSIFVRDRDYIVNGNIPVGVNANDSTAMSRMAEFICRANRGLPCGNFELDYEDGTIVYKGYTDCQDIDVSNAIIEHSIYVVALMF